MKKLNLLLFFLWIINPVFGQDIHFSNHDLMPISFNPAWTHAVYHDISAGLIYRNQSFTVTPNSYSTYGTYFQSKLVKKIRSADRLNIHGMFLSDQSGAGNLNANIAVIGLSYHLSINGNSDHVLTFGGQGGMGQLKFGGLQNLQFEEDLLGGAFSEGINNENLSYFNYALGVHEQSQISDNTSLGIGFAVANKNYLSQDQAAKSSSYKYSFNSSIVHYFTDVFSVEPRFYYQKLDQGENFMVQALGNYQLNTSQYIKLQLGGGIRRMDAAQVLFGIEISNWKLGFSYDINTSALAKASTYASGIEMGVLYKYNFPDRRFKGKKSFAIDFKKKEKVITEKEPVISVELTILDASLGKTSADIQLINQSLADTSKMIKSKELVYTKELTKDRRYAIIMNKSTYLSDTSFISSYGIKKDTVIKVQLQLDSLVGKEVIKVTKGKAVRLNNIYYDLNDYKILAESEEQLQVIYRALETYPELEIEISSHTDAQGEDAYNLNLSQKRAKSVTDWLISRGIASTRLTPMGYGESQLINHCKNGIQCSDEEHRENRRTEFKILKGPEVIYLK